MPEQSYSEQVRHPGEALNRKRDGHRKVWFWIVLGAAVFVYLLWRAGLHSGSPVAGGTVGNSNGWV